MSAKTYPYQRTLFQEVREEALEEGLEAGREEGGVRMLAQNVLLVLRSRGLAVSQAQEEKIRSCTDVDLLRGWLVKASTAKSTAEVFGG